MANSQILYGQYQIWDLFGLALTSKVFLLKKQLKDVNHGQRTHSAKIGAESLAENTPKCIRLISPIDLKFGIPLKKASMGVYSPYLIESFTYSMPNQI